MLEPFVFIGSHISINDQKGLTAQQEGTHFFDFIRRRPRILLNLMFSLVLFFTVFLVEKEQMQLAARAYF